MDRELLHRILKVQEKARSDAEYQEELVFFRECNDRLLELLPQMTEAQQQTVMDIIYYGANLHWRILAIACEKQNNAAPQ